MTMSDLPIRILVASGSTSDGVSVCAMQIPDSTSIERFSQVSAPTPCAVDICKKPRHTTSIPAFFANATASRIWHISPGRIAQFRFISIDQGGVVRNIQSQTETNEVDEVDLQAPEIRIDFGSDHRKKSAIAGPE